MTDQIKTAEEAFLAHMNGLTEQSGIQEERETRALADHLRRLYDAAGTPESVRIV